MKLASLKDGRDGRLVIVSNDLAWFTDAAHIAPTLQAALDGWETCEPQLRGLAESLEHGAVPRARFHEHEAASPLPQASPLGPRDDRPLAGDVAGEVAVILGDTPQGCAREAALAAIRLVMLGAGGVFSPVAITPDALPAWKDGRLSGVLQLELNGRALAEPDTGTLVPDFGALIVEQAQNGPLKAGAVVRSGAAARTPTLNAGDVVRVEMRDLRHHTIFGAIEQAVAAP